MNECAPDTAMGLPMREAFLLHRRQHGEDALPAFVLDHRRTADGPGLYRLRPLSRLGQGSEKHGLPCGGKLHGLRAALQGAALGPGEVVAQPAEDGRDVQLLCGAGAPIAPMGGTAHEPLHRDERTLPGSRGGDRSTTTGSMGQNIQNARHPAAVEGVVPDKSREIRLGQQTVGGGGEAPRQLARGVVAALPPFADELEVQFLTSHRGIEHPGLAADRLLSQLEISVCASEVLDLDAEHKAVLRLLAGHGKMHLFKITCGIHSGSPSCGRGVMCRRAALRWL